MALTDPEPSVAGAIDGLRESDPGIEVRNVSFRCSDSDPWILRNVSLIVRPGESVSIVGPSGCGKSTLLKIMLGLLPPTKGEVLVGGIPLSRLGAEPYRSLVSAVMQEDQLFAGSIADNISFSDHTGDRARIEQCARLASIHEEIVSMPMGYSTLIGDMGTVLSGGQKQRVLLARALYASPRILFLDEATSHLDVGREREVNKAIKQLDITRVIIVHRPETVASADRFVVLGSRTPEPYPAGRTPEAPRTSGRELRAVPA